MHSPREYLYINQPKPDRGMRRSTLKLREINIIVLISTSVPSESLLWGNQAIMKRRVTYVQHPETPFEPHQASLSPSAISIHELDAAREDRITFGLNDLPEEVRMTCYRI